MISIIYCNNKIFSTIHYSVKKTRVKPARLFQPQVYLYIYGKEEPIIMLNWGRGLKGLHKNEHLVAGLSIYSIKVKT